MENDAHSTQRKSSFQEKSSLLLQEDIKREIKGVFKTALNCIEMRFGIDFDGYEALRANILRTGNDAIRNVGRIIDDKYCIEREKEIFTVKFKDRNGLGKGEGNDSIQK